ncbi:MAG: DUF1801 domain-containing protein [Rikenellaceae bacterium]|nr:DUF1801 domain-containing protein [Rikenellaceae bacterium]
MKNPLGDFYLSRPEPAKGTLLALRGIILDFDPNISEMVKYGMPCFLYSGKILCYLWTDRISGWPYILMADGKSLTHPSLKSGGRAKMKIMTIDPDADLPVDKIADILARPGICINTASKTPERVMQNRNPQYL